MADGTLLMSFNRKINIPGLGTVDQSDIVKFIPTQLGTATAGSFEWYFDGSDVGLSKAGEEIDAIALDTTGRLVISTKGSFSVDNLSGKDEDLFVFNATSLGVETAGAWELYFDGSDIDLTKGSEDVNGAWVDRNNGNIYLSTEGNFHVKGDTGSLSGEKNDIFVCTPQSLGDTTTCSFSMFFVGDQAGFNERINGLSLNQNNNPPVMWGMAAGADTSIDEIEGLQYEIVLDEIDDSTEIDPELDEYDAEESSSEVQTVFLPLINR